VTVLASHDTLSGDIAPDYPLLLTGGVCLDDGRTIFVRTVIKTLNDKDVRHCVVLKYDGSGWQSFLINNGITSQYASNVNGWTLHSLGYNGIIHVSSQDSESEEIIDGSRFGPSKLRWMYDIKQIGGQLCAVGMSRMAYRQDSSGTWNQLGRGAEVTDLVDIEACFRSIAGFSDDHLIAVGTKGEIWQCCNGVWQQMESPTNVILHGVLCCDDGTAYACGAAGVVLRLSNNSCTVVDNDETDDHLWGISWFKGSVFIAGSNAVYKIDDNRLRKVDMGIKPTTSYLYSSSNILWSVGSSDICWFDGSTWKQLFLPKFPARL